MRPAERTVSRDVAASIFCTVCGAVSASSVVSHTDPVHAPAAPIATAAAICLPGDDAAGGQHGHVLPGRLDGVHHLGDQHQRGHLAAVPAGLGALRDDQVDAGLRPA